jgi:hypothetical protein
MRQFDHLLITLGQLRLYLETRFDSAQLRVPAGQPGGGRWTSGGAISNSLSRPELTPKLIEAQWSSLAECHFQYERDRAICNRYKLGSCWKQAADRLAACSAGRPIPPLNF